jgi:hypothetical protein
LEQEWQLKRYREDMIKKAEELRRLEMEYIQEQE